MIRNHEEQIDQVIFDEKAWHQRFSAPRHSEAFFECQALLLKSPLKIEDKLQHQKETFCAAQPKALWVRVKGY